MLIEFYLHKYMMWLSPDLRAPCVGWLHQTSNKGGIANLHKNSPAVKKVQLASLFKVVGVRKVVESKGAAKKWL